MARNDLIERIPVPENLRKRTTLVGATFYDTVEIYKNRVVGSSGSQQMIWYYRDYNGIDIINANMNSQFAQVVFLTGLNSKNRFVGIDFGATQNRNAMRDSNRLIFCSGMFSWTDANDFAASLGTKIRKAMDDYKNYWDEVDSSTRAISTTDELKQNAERHDDQFTKESIAEFELQSTTTPTPKNDAPATPQNNEGDRKIIQVSLILGIIGIVFAWVFALVGHIVSIIGIVIGAIEKKKTGKNAGLIVSIIGEVCALVSSVIGIILMM